VGNGGRTRARGTGRGSGQGWAAGVSKSDPHEAHPSLTDATPPWCQSRSRHSAVAPALPSVEPAAPLATAARKEASDPPRRILRVDVIVLGIDPGVANTGYGVVAHDRGRLVALDGGVIETRAGTDASARLAHIHAQVTALIDQYRPDAVAIEDLYFGANARSAFAVGQARGVVILAAGQRGTKTASYTPQQVKAAVCGSGKAAKEQVQRMVQTLLALPQLPRPDHAADALAVAICHANGAPMAAAVARVAG
jgi:crossover junction endodeoxyribonuclease RuvC